MESNKEELSYKILSIDAWRDGGGWTWDNWFHVGDITPDAMNWTNRKLLKYFRDENYLKESSARKCAVEGDEYNLVIVDKANHRPLYAIEYGPHV